MKTLFFLSAVLCQLLCFSQSSRFSFKLGTEYDLPRKTEDLAFFGNNKDGIVNLSLKKEELHILRFNTIDLRKTFEQKIDLDVTRNFNSEVVTDFTNGNYYWIHSDWDKSNEAEMVFSDKIDVVTGRITDANRNLFSTTKVAGEAMSTGFYSFKLTDKYQFDYDAQRKKLSITYRLVPEQKNDKKNYDVLGFQVFDDNLKKIWGQEFTMPYTEAIMDNSGFSVDGNGNAYLLAKVYDSDSRKEKDRSTGMPAYHFEVLKFTKNSKKIIIAPISLDDNYIKETSLIESPTHDMIVACTYSKKSNRGGTDGVFLAALDQNGKLIKYMKGYYEFPKEELQKFESARQRRKIEKNDDYEAANLKVRDVLVEDDGSIFIACEEYYMITSTSTSPSGTRTTYTYYYNDILASKINASGAFAWLRKIPKSQRGTRPKGTMSFKLINDASGYYFLYLDNIKNLKIAEDETPKTHVDGFGGQVIVSKLTKDGVHSKELLFDTRDEDIMIFPSAFYKINGNQFIGRAQLKKNLYQPVLITAK